MDFERLWSQLQDGANILSNPDKASVIGAGAFGAFSAEVNNLEKEALVQLDKFGASVSTTLPKPFQSVVTDLLKPARNFVNTAQQQGSAGVLPAKILGFSWPVAIGGVFVIFFALIFLVARAGSR